jgi:hypothetical protein
MSNFEIINRRAAAGLELGRAEKARMALALPHNVEEYQEKIKPDYDLGLKPVKTVVVGQDPAPGQTVPEGTEVTVTMAPKATLPLDIFVLDRFLAEKYADQDVAVVLKDLDEKGATAKAVLEKDKDFEDLGGDEKQAVKKYAEENLAFAGDDASLKDVYGDLKFLVNF